VTTTTSTRIVMMMMLLFVTVTVVKSIVEQGTTHSSRGKTSTSSQVHTLITLLVLLVLLVLLILLLLGLLSVITVAAMPLIATTMAWRSTLRIAIAASVGFISVVTSSSSRVGTVLEGSLVAGCFPLSSPGGLL
jgi:hypothetical protein